MEVKVTKDKVLIVNDNYIINKGEFDINECDFNFSEEYTNDLVKKAEFVSGEDTITILIEDGKCSVPYEMLSKEEFELRIYAFKIEDGELVLRYSPTPTTLYLREGSFKYASGEVITPSEAEQIEQEIQNLENSKQDLLVSGVNIKTINNQTILGEGNLVIEGISVDYDEISNKPKINNIELVGNKTSHDLGLQPEGNYLTEETDPIFTESVAYGITSEDITSWNAKADESDIPDVSGFITKDVDDLTNYTKTSNLANVATSGSYNDLSNTPDLSDFITKNVNDLTYYELKTATGNSIELSINSDTYVMTLNLKNSAGATISTDNIDLPLETMVVGASYDSSTKEIVLTLKSGVTTRFSVADLVSGLQTEITSSNKLDSDLVDDTNQTNKFVTTQDKTAWNAKYDLPSGGIPKTDLASAVQTSLGKADTALQSFTEQDPVFSASASAGITSSDITAWNNKSDFSGSYTDLTNKPIIPSATSQLTNDSNYVADASYVHTDNNYTTEEKTKLSGLVNYTLPTASANDLGGIKVGTGLSIDANGVLSASGGSLPVYYIETNATYRMYDKDAGVYVIKNTSQSAINVYCGSSSSYAKSIPAGKEGIIFVEDYSADKKRLFFFKGDELKNVTISPSGGGIYGSTSYVIPALLNSDRASSNSVLSIENQVSYTPTSNYHPATKKYVDDSIATQIGNINTILATLTTPSGGNS